MSRERLFFGWIVLLFILFLSVVCINCVFADDCVPSLDVNPYVIYVGYKNVSVPGYVGTNYTELYYRYYTCAYGKFVTDVNGYVVNNVFPVQKSDVVFSDAPNPSLDMWKIISIFIGACTALAFSFAAQKLF